MNRKALVIAAVFLAVIVAVVVGTTMRMGRYRCEVCMSFEGRTACKTARAASREQAERTAVTNACAEIASGMSASIECEQSRPGSVRWLE